VAAWRPGDPVTVGLLVPDLNRRYAGRGDMLVGEALPIRDGKN
jgi:hypothetical protein